jgi:hypothetical protein
MAETTLLTIDCYQQEKTHLRQRGEEKPARRISGGALAAVAANRNSPVLEIDLSYSKHWTVCFSNRDKNNLCRSPRLFVLVADPPGFSLHQPLITRHLSLHF